MGYRHTVANLFSSSYSKQPHTQGFVWATFKFENIFAKNQLFGLPPCLILLNLMLLLSGIAYWRDAIFFRYTLMFQMLRFGYDLRRRINLRFVMFVT